MDKKILRLGQKAKEASLELAALPSSIKNKALEEMAKAISNNRNLILEANKKDIKDAEKAGISSSLIERLKVNNQKINEMVNGIKSVVKLEDPVGKTIHSIELDKNLELFQVTVPIGVIGAIFESRPDAIPQIVSLCIKSGNSVILKGGSEAKNTNKAIFNLLANAANKNKMPKGSLHLIETREEVSKMLKLDDFIDLLIPRGSSKFVKFIQENTKIPVLGHSEGICHVYVDKDADLKKAVDISYDAKCQYPAVCNAIETLLVHKDTADLFFKKIIKRYLKHNVELRLDNKSLSIIKKNKLISEGVKKAAEQDWKTEYNDLILSIKTVDSAEEAINHINTYGSRHTDAIVTENKKTALLFTKLVDASSVMVNCSTRFADGFRYGKGAEIGISTEKIHARGPVGLEGLVIYKYILVGNGSIVSDYTGKNAKRFTHKMLNKNFRL